LVDSTPKVGPSSTLSIPSYDPKDDQNTFDLAAAIRFEVIVPYPPTYSIISGRRDDGRGTGGPDRLAG
jgi:hypothetical protein